MPRVPLRRDGQDDRRREGDPVCGSPSLHRCLRMRAGIFSHKDLPQGRRGARPEGKREGGRKGGGGRTGTAPHAFAKNLVKTECANISFDSGKTRRARITHAFPTTTARIGFARSRSFLSHDMFRTRDQNPEKSEADSYGDANMLPLSTDEPIAEGGGVPSLFAGSSYRTEKRKYIRKHTHLRVRRIGQNDRKPGDSAPPGECRRNSPVQRTDIRPSAVRTTRFGRLDAVSVRMSAQPEERASATRCRQGFRRPFPEAPDTNSNSPTILP